MINHVFMYISVSGPYPMMIDPLRREVLLAVVKKLVSTVVTFANCLQKSNYIIY
jgi:hypothetical protein